MAKGKIFASGNKFVSVTDGIFTLLEEEVNITGKQLLLLLWLGKNAQFYNSNRRVYKNKTLAEAVKVHVNRVGSIKDGLIELGLLRVERIRGKHWYILLNPITGMPIDELAPVDDIDEWGPDELEQPASKAMTAIHGVDPVPAQTAPAAVVVNETVTAHAPDTVPAPTEPEHIQRLAAEQLKTIYETYSVKSPEEIEISIMIQGCCTDPQRKAELVSQRSALQAQRRHVRDQVKLEYLRRTGIDLAVRHSLESAAWTIEDSMLSGRIRAHTRQHHHSVTT